MTFRDFVTQLIRKNHVRVCAEVGVWRGELSKIILETCPVDRLYMIDPWKYDCNIFEHNSKEAHPKGMDRGRYICDMDEPELSQEELDRLYEDLKKDFARFGDRVQIIRNTSIEAAKKIKDESLDFIFIDAIHLYENVKEDIQTWLPKLKKSGILAGDDYRRQFGGVIAAVNEYFPPHIRKIKKPVWFVWKSDYLNRDAWWGKRLFKRYQNE